MESHRCPTSSENYEDTDQAMGGSLVQAPGGQHAIRCVKNPVPVYRGETKTVLKYSAAAHNGSHARAGNRALFCAKAYAYTAG